MLGRWLKALLPASAAVAGLTLLLRSDTGWMFRTQISQLLHPADEARFWVGMGVYGGEKNSDAMEELYLSRLHTVADSRPDDYRANLAVMLEQRTIRQAEHLLSLLPRFGDHPQLHAHILRFLPQQVRFRRPEADSMSITVALSPPLPVMGGPIPYGAPPFGGMAPPSMTIPPSVSSSGPIMGPPQAPGIPTGGFSPTLYDLWLRLFVPSPVAEEFYAVQMDIPLPPTADRLAPYIRVAEKGEQLDPGNAYFPAMRAVLHFALRQDKEAIDALLRASLKPRWDDYVNDDPESRVHLYTFAFGRQPVHHRAQVYFSTLFPHVRVLREAARVAVYLAYQADLAGDTKRATEIRLALIRLGRLMRTQGCHVITILVGINLGQMGYQTAPELHVSDFLSPDIQPEQRAEQRLRQLEDYLRRIGRTADISWVERDLHAGIATRKIIEEGMKRAPANIDEIMTAPAWCWLR